MPDLKPCPFCGSTDVKFVLVEEGTEVPQTIAYVPACMNCDCTGEGLYQQTQKVSSAQWNLRPIESSLAAQVAELQAALCRVYQTMELPDGKHIADADWELIKTLLDSGVYDAALQAGKDAK